MSDGFWRDYLPFGWTLQTIEGPDAIAEFGVQTGPTSGFEIPAFEGQSDETEGFFRFVTSDGPGRGYIRLENGSCKTVFTQLDSLTNTPNLSAGAAEPYVLIVGGGQGRPCFGCAITRPWGSIFDR